MALPTCKPPLDDCPTNMVPAAWNLMRAFTGCPSVPGGPEIVYVSTIELYMKTVSVTCM